MNTEYKTSHLSSCEPFGCEEQPLAWAFENQPKNYLKMAEKVRNMIINEFNWSEITAAEYTGSQFIPVSPDLLNKSSILRFFSL